MGQFRVPVAVAVVVVVVTQYTPVIKLRGNTHTRTHTHGVLTTGKRGLSSVDCTSTNFLVLM